MEKKDAAVSAGLMNDEASVEESVRNVWHRVLNAQQHPPVYIRR